MLTAKEARELAENHVSDKIRGELIDAESSIKLAVESGETECWHYKYLGEQAIGNLESLGYTVINNSSQKDGIVFLITW